MRSFFGCIQVFGDKIGTNVKGTTLGTYLVRTKLLNCSTMFRLLLVKIVVGVFLWQDRGEENRTGRVVEFNVMSHVYWFTGSGKVYAECTVQIMSQVHVRAKEVFLLHKDMMEILRLFVRAREANLELKWKEDLWKKGCLIFPLY